MATEPSSVVTTMIAIAAKVSPEKESLWHRVWMGAWPFILIFSAAFLLYAPYFHNPTFFDDKRLLTVDQDLAFWHPRWLPYATFQWTYALAGFSLPWFHFGNVLLHAINAGLFFILVQQLLERTLGPQPSGRLNNTGWAVGLALLFTLHPVAVYAVGYLIQRTILMATLFSLLMVLSYLKGLHTSQQRWYWLSAVLYVLAVFCKEHVVMMPAVALSLTVLLGQTGRCRRLWPVFLLFAGIGIVITVLLYQTGVIGQAYEYDAQQLLNQLAQQDGMEAGDAWPLSIMTQGWLFFKYWLLWLLPAPAWMSIDIYQPFATHWWAWPQTLGFVVFLFYGAAAGWLLLQRGRRGLCGFALLWPWLLFATELVTVRIRFDFVLYRSYPWLLGALLLLPEIMQRWPARRTVTVLAVTALCFIPLSMNRLEVFSSRVELWRDAQVLLHAPSVLGSDRVYYNLGAAYMEQGQYPEAIHNYTQALTINPQLFPGYHNRAATYYLMHQYPAAIRDLNRALTLKAHVGLSEYLRAICYQKLGQWPAARADYAMACRDGVPRACMLAHDTAIRPHL